MASTGHIKPRKGKDGSMSYQLVVEIEPDPVTSKRNRFFRTVRGNKKEVAKALRDFQAEIDSSGQPSALSAMKVKDWMDQWLKLYLPNIEETTHRGYREKINSNPCQYVTLPKKIKYEADYYTKAEVADVLDKVKGTDLYLPIPIEFYLGLRRGELLGLHWSDIDMDKGIAHIRNNYVRGEKGAICKTPKSQAGIRDLPIGASLLPELKKARAQYNMNKLAMGTAFTDSDLVICKPDGTPYKPDTMSHKWERFLKKHSLKKIRFHDLRHTCATMLIEANVPMKTVSTFMGHSNIQITLDTYAHCTKAMEQQAADTIDNILSHVI